MHADIADKIYEAAFIPEIWRDVLHEGSLVSGSASGAVFRFRVGDPVRGIALANVQEVMDEFVSSDIWTASDSVQSMYNLRPAGFVQVDDFLTPEEIELDPVRQRLRSIGIGKHLCTAIPMPTGEVITFVFQRWLKDGGYEAAAIERLEAIRPHLARSGMIAARLGLERAHAFVNALDAVGLPAAIVTRGGRLVVANALMESVSAAVRPAAFGGLSLANPASDALFRQTLAGLAGTAHGKPGSIPLPATDALPPFVVHVLPIRGAVHDLFAGADAIVVVTTVGAKGTSPSSGVLQALFDLTPAEVRLASALATGKSVKQAAATTGTTVKTARSYLDRIFQKTGTHQQSQLLALLRSTAPIGG